MTTPIDASETWQRLAHRAIELRARGLRRLLTDDVHRLDELLIDSDAVALDVALQFVDGAMLTMLDDLVRDTGLATVRDAMFEGATVNTTEGRAVLHAPLRRSPREHLAAALRFADAVRSGEVRTASGGRFTTVVNIGIGGSDLGPRLVSTALAPEGGPEVRFVANIDPRALDDALVGADPGSTLVIMSSKSMTTVETLHNGHRARRWLAESLGEGHHAHLAAVTADRDRAVALGIDPARVFSFDEAVGGRFSVSSQIGLPVALAVGSKAFSEFLGGMEEMDEHFVGAPASRNLPIVHGTIGVLNASTHGFRSSVVVPYAHRLGLLVQYLQQLMMESNGKSVTHGGDAVASTAPAVWGAEGTNSQHAFFQWLHQGTDPVPVDFIVVGTSGDSGHPWSSTDRDDANEAQRVLVANAFAQADVLAHGHGTSGDADVHRWFPGNRPSSKVLIRRLDPRTLGALLALYEHSTVVQGWLWGINSFDQFGVERGKQLASTILAGGSHRGSSAGDKGVPTWSASSRWLGA